MNPELFQQQATGVLRSIGRVIAGKDRAIRLALTAMLAEGHLLIEDVPGVGKTMLARSLAASLDASVSRVQFTPDLLPGDVTGTTVYNPVAREFEFHPGAIFANVVIADEINRASPKTQSALLEAMAERQVTADGETHRLPSPFFVVATLNPMEMEGTYALPEAQLDRFMLRISMGYPDAQAEAAMLRHRESGDPLQELRAVLTLPEVHDLIAWARGIHVEPVVADFAVALANATRAHEKIALGASPRATLQLVRAAKVNAALDGRSYVIPDDLLQLALPVFAHRLIPQGSPGQTGVSDALLSDVLSRVPAPVAKTRRVSARG